MTGVSFCQYASRARMIGWPPFFQPGKRLTETIQYPVPGRWFLRRFSPVYEKSMRQAAKPGIFLQVAPYHALCCGAGTALEPVMFPEGRGSAREKRGLFAKHDMNGVVFAKAEPLSLRHGPGRMRYMDLSRRDLCRSLPTNHASRFRQDGFMERASVPPSME